MSIVLSTTNYASNTWKSTTKSIQQLDFFNNAVSETSWICRWKHIATKMAYWKNLEFFLTTGIFEVWQVHQIWYMFIFYFFLTFFAFVIYKGWVGNIVNFIIFKNILSKLVNGWFMNSIVRSMNCFLPFSMIATKPCSSKTSTWAGTKCFVISKGNIIFQFYIIYTEDKLFTRYSLLFTCYSLLLTRYSLLFTCFAVPFYSLLVTFYSLLVAFYSSLVPFYWLLVTFYFSFITTYSSLIIFYSLFFIFNF